MKVAKEELLGHDHQQDARHGLRQRDSRFRYDELGFKREKILTATATAKLQGSAQLDEETVSSIRQLVRGAVAGMKSENVTVIDQNGRYLARHSRTRRRSRRRSNSSRLQRTNEKDLKTKYRQ